MRNAIKQIEPTQGCEFVLLTTMTIVAMVFQSAYYKNIRDQVTPKLFSENSR